MSFLRILNFDRIPLIEEHFGVILNNINVELEERDDKEGWKLTVKGGIATLNKSGLEQDLSLKMTAFDPSSKCVAIYKYFIEAASFYRDDDFEFSENFNCNDVDRVRLFITKG